MQHQTNKKKTNSKTNYEDCFVYDESRFTGTLDILCVAPGKRANMYFFLLHGVV